MGFHICAACDRNLPQSSFTVNEYFKGPGVSRCASCIYGTYPNAPPTERYDGGRYNQSSEGTVSTSALKNPFAQGAFRWVAKGKYTSGPREGQACVVKWFKTGAVFSNDYFTLDIKAVDTALEIVDRFNALGIVNKPVKVNVAQVWTFDDDVDDEWAGQKHLCEPFIQNYQRFNSNTGWTDYSVAWGEVMQALSHFSYHTSGGNYLLCDLQGGIYHDEVALSDPVVLSPTREYGVTDLGPEGISSFFSQHVCNNFCRPHWIQPANPVQYFVPRPGTAMVPSSTASSRTGGTSFFY
ncbi:elongation factor 2 kinase [Stachybotrys elegans]|uniref:Elongation factor 2 kinase n=1 Tax=Stachybotrys elegans TaxID=80388 RepID=A0A8K0SHQ8_9HYPO|nr:elongation factor 2 kinase [Stachybotrys elegans]